MVGFKKERLPYGEWWVGLARLSDRLEKDLCDQSESCAWTTDCFDYGLLGLRTTWITDYLDYGLLGLWTTWITDYGLSPHRGGLVVDT